MSAIEIKPQHVARPRLARVLTMAAYLALLSGCATLPGTPYGVWDGGMRGPDDQACSISPDGTELLPCPGMVKHGR